jgi:hypothetical protein
MAPLYHQYKDSLMKDSSWRPEWVHLGMYGYCLMTWNERVNNNPSHESVFLESGQGSAVLEFLPNQAGAA